MRNFQLITFKLIRTHCHFFNCQNIINRTLRLFVFKVSKLSKKSYSNIQHNNVANFTT